MADFVFNSGKLRLWAGATGEIDLINDAAVKMIALQDDTGENVDDEFISDFITAGEGVEVTSTGYTGGFAGAGRKALASKALAVDLTNNRAEFDCADVTWSSISLAAAETWVSLIIAKEVTSDAASPLIAHIDSFSAITPNGSDITATINAEGLLQCA